MVISSVFDTAVSKQQALLRLLIISHLAMLVSLLLWITPLTQPLLQSVDNTVFYLFNGALEGRPLLQTLIGILNHKRETNSILLVAALFNVWAILATKGWRQKKEVLLKLLYFWIWFQIGYMLQHWIFFDWLTTLRNSPSLVFDDAIRLSEVLQNPNIKDFSRNAFPGGHAFALIYWAAFSKLCSPKWIGNLGFLMAIFLCLPRIFSGAHWLTDAIFSVFMAYAWLAWTLFPLLFLKLGVKQSVLKNRLF